MVHPDNQQQVRRPTRSGREPGTHGTAGRSPQGAARVGMRDEILAQPAREPPWMDRERWNRALTPATVARGDFPAAVIRTLRTPPGPEQGEEEL